MLDVGMLAKETQGTRRRPKYVSRWTGWLRSNRSNIIIIIIIIINSMKSMVASHNMQWQGKQ